MDPSNMPPPEQGMPGPAESGLPPFEPATPTSPSPKNDSSGSGNPTPAAPAGMTIDSLLHEEACTTSQPNLPTPSTTASPSVRALSPITFSNWNNRAKKFSIGYAKDAHYRRGRIFDKTRQQMRHNTRKIKVLSSRGFERARYVPTKTTTKPLFNRRYSIDVLTKDWDNDSKIYHLREDVYCSHEGSLSPDRTCTCVTIAGTSSQANHCIDNYQLCTNSPGYEEYEVAIQQTPAVPLPNPLRYQHLNTWAAKRPPHDSGHYLTLGDGTLENRYFNYILTVDGSEAWMDDSSFNMSLEALRLLTDCDAHCIDVVNSNMSQIFLFALQGGDCDATVYDVYRERLKYKRWIFVPMNDGVGGGSELFASGSHWSLVVMDCVHKTRFYYDSMGINRFNTIQKLGEKVSEGLLLILHENPHDWEWRPQENSPNQWHNNQYKWDHGPCGPFVWKMTSIMIDWIKTAQYCQNELDLDLRLSNTFPEWFEKDFNSYHVRWEMRSFIAHFKMTMDPPGYIEEHDQAAVAGEDVVLSYKLPAVIAPPPRPVQEESAETVVEDDGDHDGGIGLHHEPLNLIGDDDHLEEFRSDSSTALSEPAEDIKLDDDDAMTSMQPENNSQDVAPWKQEDDGSRLPVSDLLGARDNDDEVAVDYRQIHRATSRRARSNTPELDEDIESLVSHCDSQRRRANSIESDNWSTEGDS